MELRLCQHTIRFPRPAIIMGIVNVTDDSFYPGSRCPDVTSAIARAVELAEAGAEIIDVGGESTRPGAEPVPVQEELRRVVPVIEGIAARHRVLISVDTMKPEVARAALQAGACMVNDVGANRQDPTMWAVAAEFSAGYVCMHMQGTPQTMQLDPRYTDVVAEVERFFEDRLWRMAEVGLKPEQVVLDPGIGFGKTVEHNLQLLAHLHVFKRFGRPLMIGVSRKSFIGRLFGVDVQDRLPGSLACACWSVVCGAHIIRVHDVRETVQAVRMFEFLQSKAR